jgi:hypothetical protein
VRASGLSSQQSHRAENASRGAGRREVRRSMGDVKL